MAQLWAAQNPYNQPQSKPLSSQRVWVKGEQGANAYLVANNTEQVLWDTDNPVVYIKTVDSTGSAYTLILDYVIRNPKPDVQNDIEGLKNELTELKQMMRDMMNQQNQRYNYKQNKKPNTGVKDNGS